MKRLKRLSSFGTASVLAFSALLNIALAPAVSAAADTCTWTGGGSDNNFSTAANWTGCDNGNVPEAGDTLRFNTIPASDVTLNNDLGVQFGGLVSTVIDSANSGVYKVSSMAFAGDSVIGFTPGSTCSELEMPKLEIGTITGAGNLTINSSARISNGQSVINVSGNLTINSGWVRAASGSSVTGGVIVSSPTQLTTAVNCSGGMGAAGDAPGSSITGFTINNLTVQKGNNVMLGNAAFPITLGGGSGSTPPSIGFNANQDGDYNPVTTTYTVSSAITLLDDAVFSPNAKVTTSVTGSISGSGKQITKDRFALGALNISPAANTSGTQTGVLRNAPVTTSITDATASSIAVADNEIATLDGSRTGVSVYPGGVLKGTGTSSSYISVLEGGIIAPGHSPGILSSGDLTLAGTYQFELGGTTPGAGHDQIKVTGTVDVTNGTLEAILYNGFVPTVGQSYTIIDNDGSDAVTGTFAGIAEGGEYTNTGVTYSVTYKGGDGNDVVLTVTAIDESQLPKAPDTGFKLLVSNPIVTLVAAVFAAAAILVVRSRLQAQPARRRK